MGSLVHTPLRSPLSFLKIGNLSPKTITYCFIFLQKDFNKIRLKREEEARLLQARIPLQKSVSTPSILAVATRDTSSSYVKSERAAITVNTAVPNAANFTSST